jgi:rRNA processing protein Krr1/Pno1
VQERQGDDPGHRIQETRKDEAEIGAAWESKIAVYYTVGVISRIDSMEYALEAIHRIIRGSELSKIYDYLARSKRELLKNRLTPNPIN